MATRQKRTCSNCPKAKQVPKTSPVEAKAIAPPLTFEANEALRLWKHVLFGTGTCISMIEGYARMNLPGDSLEGVKQLRDRLNQVIQTLEQQ